MIVPIMAISNLVLTQQINYSEQTNSAHAHNRDRIPLTCPMGKCFFLGNSNYRRIVINPANQKGFGAS